MFHKRCFVYLCYDFPIIGILYCILCHKRCFVYLCYDFPIIGILCLTSVVLYICVMNSLLLVFYVSQALFCISVLWFPYYWYFMFHKRCFVHLCYDFPIIDILCFTRLFCISVLWFPYNLYFMFHKELFCIFVYFPIICILCLTRVVLYICVLLSLLLVFYVSQALFCISVLWFPYNWYFMFHKVVLCICVVLSL